FATAQAAVEELTRRRDMLTRTRDQLRGAEGTARALMERGSDGSAVGVLGDLLRVPPGLEAAVSGLLAAAIAAVVVADEAAALVLVAELQGKGNGRVMLLPLDRMQAAEPPPDLAGVRGVRGIAATLVECEPRFRPLVDALLGRCAI